MLGGFLLVLLVSSAPTAAGQTKEAVDQWIRTHYEAVTIYRAGNTAKALELLDTIAVEDREKTVAAIRGQVERIAAGWAPRNEDVVRWTPSLLRALASLEMEAAATIMEGDDRTRSRAAGLHTALASSLFTLVASVTKEHDQAAARWLLAIGLKLMARAEFQMAWAILMPACRDHENYPPLLVACGSLMETYASMPADRMLPLQFRDPRVILGRLPPSYDLLLGPGVRGTGRGRAARDRYFDEARTYFEAAIKLDPADNEAPLRLANVRMHRGNERGAAELLEELLTRRSLDTKYHYLVRLFLSRIRDRQNRLDDAAALLAEAPSAQSILIARSYNAARRGSAREAATLAEDAARSTIADPWWGYRFGQYWVPAETLKALREEALK